jgi:hypothetical protein
MLDHLEWNSLETCRSIAKVTMLCKITNNLVAINLDFYIFSQTSHTRHSHSLRYKPFSTSTDYFKFSLFPHTVVLWNALSSDIVSVSSLNHRFKPLTSKQLSMLYTGICKYRYVTFFYLFYYLLIVNILTVHGDAY